MLKTVVCDDEPPALELMASLLVDTHKVEIVAACQSVREALAVINQGGVDLVVFDIEMPDLSGVDAFGQVAVEPRPLVVFATAHSEYAVEAFGVDAIDYILKPFNSARVKKAVDKAARLSRLVRERQEGAPIEASQTPPADLSGVLKIKDAGKSFFIPYRDIIWIEAAGDYSILHMAGREITVRVAIKALEAELPDKLFVRVHRSSIIALASIREVDHLPKGEAQVLLSDGSTVRTSRSYRDVVQKLGVAG